MKTTALQLEEQHDELIANCARALRKSIPDIEDAYQDVVISILENDPDVDNLGAYLHNAVRNRLYTECRTQLISDEYPDDACNEDLGVTHDVRAAVGKLDAGIREVVELHYIYGMTVPEIASKMRKTGSWVDITLRKGTKQLRSLLEDYDDL